MDMDTWMVRRYCAFDEVVHVLFSLPFEENEFQAPCTSRKYTKYSFVNNITTHHKLKEDVL